MAGAWFIHWPVWTVRLVRGLYGPVLWTFDSVDFGNNWMVNKPMPVSGATGKVRMLDWVKCGCASALMPGTVVNAGPWR